MKSFFTETTSSGSYFEPLTGLRGLAALSVLFYHVFIILVPVGGSEHWLVNHVLLPAGVYGFLGVQLFFVLSGFLLSFYFLSAHRKGVKPSYWQFIRNRCLRVLPSFYFQLIFLTAVYTILSLKEIDVRNFIHHVLMLHNFDYRISGSINGVFWTLPIEWDFYYLMPFLALLLTGKRWLWLLISVLVIGILVRVILGEYVVPKDVNLFYRIAVLTQVFSIPEYFVFGMLMAFWRDGLSEGNICFKFGDLIMLTGAILFAVSVSFVNWHTYWITSQHYIWNSIAPIALSIFVFGASLNGKFARLLFANRGMMALGILSYGLYLWHLIVIELVKGDWFNHFSLFSHLSLLDEVITAKLLLTFLMVLILTIIVAYLNYRFIEKPFLAFKYTRSK